MIVYWSAGYKRGDTLAHRPPLLPPIREYPLTNMIDLLDSNDRALVRMSLILALSSFPLGAASKDIQYVNLLINMEH